jgi:hypothetical protein
LGATNHPPTHPPPKKEVALSTACLTWWCLVRRLKLSFQSLSFCVSASTQDLVSLTNTNTFCR